MRERYSEIFMATIVMMIIMSSLIIRNITAMITLIIS